MRADRKAQRQPSHDENRRSKGQYQESGGNADQPRLHPTVENRHAFVRSNGYVTTPRLDFDIPEPSLGKHPFQGGGRKAEKIVWNIVVACLKGHREKH